MPTISEKDINIKVDSEYSVYGRLSGALDQPLVIIVHGLCCSLYDGLYEDAAQWFPAHGYAVYRFNFYCEQKDGRQLIDSTLRTQADDLDAVVRYFRKRGVKKVFVAGHSFGGPTILLSKEQKFTGAALWDGSYDISFIKEKYGYPGGKYIKALNGYFMRWGTSVIIGKAMADEVDALQWDALPKNFHNPLAIFPAGNGMLIEGSEKYYESANEPKLLQVVDGATHFFADTPQVRQSLFRATKKWFDRML